MNKTKARHGVVRLSKSRISLAAIGLLAGAAGSAMAFEVDTGNEDLTLRWDTQVRYNTGVRMEGINPDFANSPLYDSTERSVKRYGLVMNRVDVLTEADLIYKRDHGVRISATAWNDFSASQDVASNPALTAAGFGSEYNKGRFNGYADRFSRGLSGELLDAFAFTQLNIGNVPTNLKLGQHTVYSGEGLYTLFHSVSYSQAPLNLFKAQTSPGLEAKELFMPVAQLSAQAQITPELSLAGQYLLDWKASRLPAGGTYFGSTDFMRADSMVVAPGVQLPIGPDSEPSKKRGQFGVNARWAPGWLDGTLGFYYRKFNEVLPWAGVTGNRDFRLAFAANTELYGVSLAKTFGGASVGAEVSYRKNTALNSTGIINTGQGYEGARGNTWHALVNAIYLLPKSAISDGGTLQGELVYNYLDKVTENANLFNGESVCNAKRLAATSAGCSTRDYLGIQIGGSLDYPQAFPGVNLSVPFSLSYGLKGNAPVISGGNEGAVTWSLGVEANYLNKHTFTLKYNDGRQRYSNVGGNIIANGSNPVANSHGWLSFTYKTSF